MFERALLSVSDKRGIVEFAQKLVDRGVEILSTGGTARALAEGGVPVRSVEDFTGANEMLGGRVKTLHPLIHGGILFLRDDPAQSSEAQERGVAPIDLVVVNLYPFDEASKSGDFDHALENIDIGGPTMVRSAAKNHAHVAVVVSPDRYDELVDRMDRDEVDIGFRRTLALDAFRHTARYDSSIGQYLGAFSGEETFPAELGLPMTRVASLRYGENPHQGAAFFEDGLNDPLSLAAAKQLNGKQLSFNNLGDLSASLELVCEFDQPAAAVIKHANPSGCAVGATAAQAYVAAREGDPVSAFGSVVALNRPVDRETAERVAETFVEAVLAPSFTEEALERLRKKKNLRLLELPAIGNGSGRVPRGFDLRRVAGGFLVQERDGVNDPEESWRVATRREPSEAEWDALRFGWRVCRRVKSNAIVFARDGRTIGVGAGQMSRVDAVRIAVRQAETHGHEAAGAVMASDAFFPFQDGIDVAHAAGIAAVIQPGGSKRDEEVIAAANEHGMAMVLTGRRHFRH